MRIWKLASTEVIFDSEYLSVFSDKVLLPSGEKIAYTRVELKDFVAVLPILRQDRIVTIEIYRYPANALSLEIPGGRLEDREDPEEVATRELEEETGYRAGKLRSLGWYHPWTRSIQKAHIFIAEDLTQGTMNPSFTENIKIRLLSTKDIKGKLLANEITHAPTIIALQRFLLMQ